MGPFESCHLMGRKSSRCHSSCPKALIQIVILTLSLRVFVSQEKVKLQYRLTFTMGEQEHSESGSLEQFPPPEKWGNL